MCLCWDSHLALLLSHRWWLLQPCLAPVLILLCSASSPGLSQLILQSGCAPTLLLPTESCSFCSGVPGWAGTVSHSCVCHTSVTHLSQLQLLPHELCPMLHVLHWHCQGILSLVSCLNAPRPGSVLPQTTPIPRALQQLGLPALCPRAGLTGAPAAVPGLRWAQQEEPEPLQSWGAELQ